MEVLILAQYSPPDMGGSSTRAYNACAIFNNKDNFIIMCSGILGLAYDFKNVLMAVKFLSDTKNIQFDI